MDTLDLSAFFKTKAQALDFSARLAAFSQEVYETHFSLDASLAHHFGLHQKDHLLALFRTHQVRTDKASELKTFVTQLQAHINALPVLSLSLAFEPKDATLTILTDWFLLNVKRQVLFDIQVDPSLIAGVVIHFNGRFIDYTIRNAFANALTAVAQQSEPSVASSKRPVSAQPATQQPALAQL